MRDQCEGEPGTTPVPGGPHVAAPGSVGIAGRIIHNPSFDVSRETLQGAIRRMRAEPAPAGRPLIVLGGWRAPHVSPLGVAIRLRGLVGADPRNVVCISYAFRWSIQAAAAKAHRIIAERGWLDRDVDIVAISMGGLVARTLLSPSAAGLEIEPVRAARLITLATPHRGAMLARIARPDRAARDMLPGSQLLQSLDRALPNRTYELHCYALLRDWWVGATNAAPPGMHAMWLDPASLPARMMAHFAINFDMRILADVALRLRGETPWSSVGAAPPTY